jgi:TolA-binding protein
MKWTLFASSLLVLNLCTFSTAIANGTPDPLDLQDRQVDQAALISKRKAIEQLKKLIQRHRGTPQEPLMWVKLAEYQQQASGVEFRIAHGQAHRSQGAAHLGRYQRSLNEVVATTTLLIQKFSKQVNIDQVYFMRGSSYEELKKKELAKKDYLSVIRNFPDSPWASQSTMSVAEFAIEDNQHAQAIQYLKAVEALPDDPHYPFALYKLAWSHFNLKHIPTAIDYLKKHILYYRDSTLESDQAILEHSLQDFAAFYFQGFEDHLPNYSTSEALKQFRLVESGTALGQMALRYAKLLRAHTHDADLIQWKNQLIQEEFMRAETLDVVLLSLDYFLNKKQLGLILECASQLSQIDTLSQKKMRSFKNYSNVQTQILNSADRLQKMTVKNKDATELDALVRALQGVYQAFIDIAQDDDVRVPRTHYNLAETLFQIRDFDKASENYRWILEHRNLWKKTQGIAPGVGHKEILLKLISSRYQTLDKRKIIPKKLALQKYNPDTPDTKDPTDRLPPDVSQWVSWLDEYLDQYGHDRSEIEDFEFEANRTLYSQAQVATAIHRFREFIKENPKSKHAIPAASLILDTFISSELWLTAHEESREFIELFQSLHKEVKRPTEAFITRLKSIESDSYYKLIENDSKNKKYADALKKIRTFQKLYSNSTHSNDCLLLASRITQETQQKELALEFLTALIQENTSNEFQTEALLQRAGLEEEKYQFEAALQDELLYLKKKKPSPELIPIYKRVIFLRWLTRGVSEIQLPKELTKDLNEENDRYIALGIITHPPRNPSSEHSLLEKALHGAKSNRVLWSLAALKQEKNLTFHEIQNLTRFIASSWDQLDAISQYSTLSTLQDALPQAMKQSRDLMKKLSPLKATSKSIEHRIQFMNEIERTSSKLVKLPWARIKAEVLGEASDMYLLFATDLAHLPIPKDLMDAERTEYLKSVQEIIVPFAEKGKKLKAQAFEVATEFSVQKEIVKRLQPSPLELSETLRSAQSFKSLPISIELWKELETQTHDPISLSLQTQWIEAVKQAHFGRIAFFMQELKNKSSPPLSPPSTLSLMRAISLISAGAQAEAIAELESSLSEFGSKDRLKINHTLYSYYLDSISEKKFQATLDRIRREEK